MSRDVREKSDHRGLERVRVTSGVGWGEVMWGGSQHLSLIHISEPTRLS